MGFPSFWFDSKKINTILDILLNIKNLYFDTDDIEKQVHYTLEDNGFSYTGDKFDVVDNGDTITITNTRQNESVNLDLSKFVLGFSPKTYY